MLVAFVQYVNPGCFACAGMILEAQFPHAGLGQNRQVRSIFNWIQEGSHRAPAFAVTLIHLKIGVAKIVATIEFIDFRNAAVLSRFAPDV